MAVQPYGSGASSDSGKAAERIIDRNRKLREAFLRDFEQRTITEVGPQASAWLRSGEVFAVSGDDQDLLFPAFQFDRVGRPRRSVVAAARALRSGGASSWAIALWFTGPDPWLRDVPLERIDDDPKSVLAAAKRAVEPAW